MKSLFLTIVFMGTLLMPLSVRAQTDPQCNKRDSVLELLAKKYKEAPSAMGVTSKGALLEVFTSERGTWTVILTTPRGISCLLGAGEGWRALAPLLSLDPEA